MRREIEWEPFRDPLVPLNLQDLTEDDGYDLIGRTWGREELVPSPYRGPYLYGPFGVIPLNESNLPSKLYKLWVGHTNFVLGKKEVAAIERVEGVEVLRPFSPYRFWLGVGKLFEDKRVKTAIEKVLCPLPAYSSDQQRRIDYLSWYMSTKYPHWAVVCKSNGKFDTMGGSEEGDVRNKVGSLEVLAASWDEEGGDERGNRGCHGEPGQPQPHEE